MSKSEAIPKELSLSAINQDQGGQAGRSERAVQSHNHVIVTSPCFCMRAVLLTAEQHVLPPDLVS
jgi:hypothetical protein